MGVPTPLIESAVSTHRPYSSRSVLAGPRARASRRGVAGRFGDGETEFRRFSGGSAREREEKYVTQNFSASCKTLGCHDDQAPRSNALALCRCLPRAAPVGPRLRLVRSE